jgi:phage antirepressor YoqD-like protein
MGINELAEHFKMDSNDLVRELYLAGLVYRIEADPKPTQKAIEQWVCEVRKGEFEWDAHELWFNE